ncbi:MAG: ATP-dependent zinc metalloprotease FtsH [Sorangiineae bacterium]|nr:ATP-dependent zinc metalloprotease FtsH [Polyangiaceae bacterium]MEB2321107.1 ATP-dependent zinc metalloprotease FtsH [Sorangiineae bacterium]
MPDSTRGPMPSGAPPAGRPPTPSEGSPARPSWKGWALIGLLLLGFWGWQYFGAKKSADPPISYTAFYQLVSGGHVKKVTLRGQEVRGTLAQKQKVEGVETSAFRTVLPAQEDKDLLPLLREKAVAVDVETEGQSLLVEALLGFLPLLLIIAFWLWMSRRAQKMMAGGAGGPFGGMMKGRSRRFERQSQVAVKFEDVAGLRAAKQDLTEIVDFLKQPDQFRRLGGKVPRGVLLVGPPGTGKTLLARAVAGESGVPFFSINGSEFIELFVGVGAARVRELFEEAKKNAPAIVFIDEIDAVGRSRGAGVGGGHDEREQTLNQLLSEMDGFTRNELVVVLAATNRPDVLDSALLRPGRFDRRVIIDRPELAARLAILKVHTRDKPLGADVELERTAANTPGFSGADLANLVNEAALSATRRGANAIEAADFRSAYDKIVLGDPRETKLDPAEKHRVAIHEAGHAVVAHFSAHAEPLHRVTIIPRGMALGVTQQTPAADKHIMTQEELEAQLRVLMGGYTAEQVVLGGISSGAANDLQKATDIAFKMVAHFGMSPKVGPVFHEHRTEHPFLGQMIATEGGTSDATVHLIEEETRRILGGSAAEANRLITEHRAALDRLVAVLMDKESIEDAELVELLGPSVTPAGLAEPRSAHLGPAS